MENGNSLKFLCSIGWNSFSVYFLLNLCLGTCYTEAHHTLHEFIWLQYNNINMKWEMFRLYNRPHGRVGNHKPIDSKELNCGFHPFTGFGIIFVTSLLWSLLLNGVCNEDRYTKSASHPCKGGLHLRVVYCHRICSYLATQLDKLMSEISIIVQSLLILQVFFETLWNFCYVHLG